jgi:hypothetical protein
MGFGVWLWWSAFGVVIVFQLILAGITVLRPTDIHRYYFEYEEVEQRLRVAQEQNAALQKEKYGLVRESVALRNSIRIGYYRVRLGDTHPELIANLKDLHRSWWSGITPDSAPIFSRDVSTDEIYALDLELP